jgi:hypothetical protein
MDGRGRAKHDYRDIGGRTNQETESRRPEPGKRMDAYMDIGGRKCREQIFEQVAYRT